MIFSKMNRTIPFLEEDDMENSLLYKPVESLAPMIFPYIIKSEETQESASNTSI